MKTRAFMISAAAAAILLAAMFVLALMSERAGYGDLLMASPRSGGLTGMDPGKLEELCEDEFLVTFEIPQRAEAEALRSRHTVTLIGTNAAYPAVMGYGMADGSFFTKSAWDSKSRHAVLNEAAAFAIFGSINISGGTIQLNGETWIITGVVRDGADEEINIYAPSSATGGRPRSLIAMTGQKENAAYVTNTLESIGVRETDYDFVNLSRAASAFGGRFSVAWRAALCAVIILAGKRGAQWVIGMLPIYRGRLRTAYPAELLSRHKTELAKICGIVFLLIAGAAATLYFSLQILDICLGWRELSLPLPNVSGDFAAKLEWIYSYQPAGTGIFLLFLPALGCTLVTGWRDVTIAPLRRSHLCG